MPASVSPVAESAQFLPVSVIDIPSSPAKEHTTTATVDCELEVELAKLCVRVRCVSPEFTERVLPDRLNAANNSRR